MCITQPTQISTNESDIFTCVASAITLAKNEQIQRVKTLRTRLVEQGFDTLSIDNALTLIQNRLRENGLYD